MGFWGLTCEGCGGRRLSDVRDEDDFVIHRQGDKRVMSLPMMLCLDCGGTSHSMKKIL